MSTLMDSNSKKTLRKSRNPFSALGDLKEELKKVTWTTKAELFSATKVVIFSMFGFGSGIYLVDLLIKGVLEGVKWALLFIFG